MSNPILEQAKQELANHEAEVKRLRKFITEFGTPEWDYPDPAERYEDLHREQREYERDYDRFLED